MASIDFGCEVSALSDGAIELAKSHNPDFELAREMLTEAEQIVVGEGDRMRGTLFAGRNANDLGVVDIREGLYLRQTQGSSHDAVLIRVETGIFAIKLSYELLKRMLTSGGIEEEVVEELGWRPEINGQLAGTLNTWFRATQTLQLLTGEIGKDKKADKTSSDKQWMLGKGTSEDPGAWARGQAGNNGYFSVQTAFLGMRGERINDGFVHGLKAAKWGLVRGVPELVRLAIQDPQDRKQAIKSAGRLTLESLSRNRAIEAALDYGRF